MANEIDSFGFEQTRAMLYEMVKSNPSVAKDENQYNIDDMANEVTKDLLDAKLETIETRMDARVLSIETGLKVTNDKIDTLLSDIKSLKTTTITVAVGSVLTVLFGVAGFNAALLSNMVSSYESGKNTATAITESTNELKNTKAELTKIYEELKSKKSK